jgi:hypothetical protein
MRTRIPASTSGVAMANGSSAASPRPKITGLAVIGYLAALLVPAIGLAFGAYLRWGRDERFHGTGVMVVASAMIALCVVSTLAMQ